MGLSQEQQSRLQYETDLILDLDLCWEAHQGQLLVKNSLFSKGKKQIFIECGRKFGKSEMLIYLLYRYALSNPNSTCYFIAPFQKQAKELVWANNRLKQFFMPVINPKTGLTHKGHNREQAAQIYKELKAKYMAGDPNESEMRIKFKNGSFIKLDGADQYEAYRGINPHLIVYDEFKDHHPKFHNAMDPNLATFNAPLIIVGTPPEGDEDNAANFIDLASSISTADDGEYFNFPTHVNPHINIEWLKKKKVELIRRGKEDVWLREYMAKRVKAGTRAIFPMFDSPDPLVNRHHTKHVIPYTDAIAMVKRNHKDWNYFMTYDPASISCFAVTLTAINKVSKKVVVLDEIYETDKKYMSTRQIYPRSLRLLEGLPIIEDDVRKIYDYAAAWFAGEVANNYGVNLEPCVSKLARDSSKEAGINLIKDMFVEDCLIYTDRCKWTIWETTNYRTDEKGKIPKENDHALDTLRYTLANAYYNVVPKKEVKVESERRAFTIDEDLREVKILKDPFAAIYEDYYE